MSMSDLLYPGNHARREKCIRLSQEIYDAMKCNFVATNDLIKIMRDKLGIKCATLTFDGQKTIKENATNLTDKIHEIQGYLDGELHKYKARIEPHLYEKLLSDGLSLTDKFRHVKLGAKGFEMALGVLLTIRAIYQTINVVSRTLKEIGKIWVGAMVLGVLVLAADLIISAIVGAKEKKALEKTQHELELVVEDFCPASRAYTKEINRLEFRLDDLKDQY